MIFWITNSLCYTAIQMDISLGKVNDLIKSGIQNNYLVKLEKGYEITEEGFEFLRNEMEKLRLEKIKLNNDEDKYSVDTAVILAAGENKEFEIPVTNLEIEGKSILRRNIEILKEEGIKKIYIVVGFKADEITEEFKDDAGVKFIKNEKFKWTGNMESLSLIKDYVEEDFLLAEGESKFGASSSQSDPGQGTTGSKFRASPSQSDPGQGTTGN